MPRPNAKTRAAAKTPKTRVTQARWIQDQDPAWTQSGSLSDKAYSIIKRMIITLELRPGQYLSEAQVCNTIELGRTPVHQALHRLMLEGLIEIVPRKGLIIRPDSLNEILDLIEARSVIEPYCAGLVVDRAPPRLVERLQDIIDRSHEAAISGAIETFMELDVALHSALSQASGNGVLRDTLRTLHDRGARIWFLQVWRKADMILTQREHARIVQAIAKGDKQAAMAEVGNHLASLRRRVLRGAN